MLSIQRCIDRFLLSTNEEGHELVSNGAVMGRGEGERFSPMELMVPTFQGVAPVGQDEDPAVASSNEQTSSDARPILSHGAQVRPVGLSGPCFFHRGGLELMKS